MHSAALSLHLRRLCRYVRSPKGYLLVALIGLAAAGAPSTGVGPALADLAVATLTATALDLTWVRIAERAWRVPSSALLSGLIVGLVLSAQEPWYVAATAAAVAIAAKHLLRLQRSHVFNPAATGLLAVFFLFGSGQSWWGALANFPLLAVLPVAVAGMVVAGRANKLPAALAFLGTYVSLFTLAALAGQSAAMADIFRAPFVNMAVFFGFLMLTDPPTSPVPFPAQAVFGAGAAVVCFTVFLTTHGLYFLLAGVLVADLGYAVVQAVRRSSPAAARLSPALAGFESPIVSVSAVTTALALLLILAAAVAVLRESDSSPSDAARAAAPQQPAVRRGIAAAPPPAGSGGALLPPSGAAALPSGGANPAGLAFQDQFTGTLVQHTDQTGSGTVDIEISGTGERAVHLAITLQLTAVARGRPRVTGNQATLSDANGAQLCQGEVTTLDDSGFTVRCDGAGNAGSTAIVGTITGGTADQLQGNLQVGLMGS